MGTDGGERRKREAYVAKRAVADDKNAFRAQALDAARNSRRLSVINSAPVMRANSK